MLKWFYNLRIRTKLLSGFIFIILITGLIGYVGITNINTFNSNFNATYSSVTQPLATLVNISGYFEMTRADLRDVVISKQHQTKVRLAKEIADYQTTLSQYVAQFGKSLNQEDLQNSYNNLQTNLVLFQQAGSTISNLALQGDNADAVTLLRSSDVIDAQNNAEGAIANLFKLENQNGRQHVAAFAVASAAADRVTYLLLFIGLVLAVGFSLFLASYITKPLNRLVGVTEMTSTGDLTSKITVNSKDEIGKLEEGFLLMIKQMRELVGQVVGKANSIASASHQIASSSQQTSTTATQTAVTMTDMANTVDNVNKNVKAVAESSKKAADYASKGSEELLEINRQIKTISSSTDAVAGSFEKLNNKTQKISQILELITSIAAQTNLLALNAAIEAARAGEHGKGFAVVAEEVRKLSEQSTGSAKQIGGLIESIQQDVKSVVSGIISTNSDVDKGAKVIAEVGQSFQEIINYVQGLSGKIQDLASDVERMSSGIESVAATAEEQTSIMEEASASSQSLSALAEEMNSLVERFTV